MPTASTLTVFVIAAILLVATPGPSVLYIVARSLDQGRLAGFVSALGIELGTLVHVIAAAFGVSALLMSSALAFAVVKYAGALYLIYLGIRTLMSRSSLPPERLPPQSLKRIFVQGAMVNILNPKAALFFLAVLPQFVDPTRGSVVSQMLVFGFLLALIGFGSDNLYALAAGTARHWFRRNTRFLQTQRYVAGCTYVSLGLATALTGEKR